MEDNVIKIIDSVNRVQYTAMYSDVKIKASKLVSNNFTLWSNIYIFFLTPNIFF